MGGPSWFSPDFPALAARRDPFPDVDRWQTTYVRYASSEAAQVQGWDAETCRRSLHSMGLNEHPILRQINLPEGINMRIIEAPAEFALPVKQDRRLLPCFKVRLEVQHRGAVSLPLTLRAHVLSQQDKDQITSWTPPDDLTNRDDKGQKAATELKGTALIRCTLEAGSAGEMRTVGIGGKDSQAPTQPSSAGPGQLGYPSSGQMRGGDRTVKPEPSFGFSGAANGPANMGAMGGGGGLGLGGQRGLHHEQHVLDPYGMVDPPGLGNNGLLRDMGAGPNCPPREVGFNALFAANRPDPVVTLASSGRLSGTGSSLSGLGSGLGGAVLGTAGNGLTHQGLIGTGLRMNTGDTRDAFDAAVEMLMQPSQQQQRRSSPLHGMLDSSLGGSKLLNDMQRQMQQQQDQEQIQRQQQDRPAGMTNGGSSCGGSVAAGQMGGKLITATQDFEFTNLEFLKPTRMNKVYMAFTVSLLDTDLLFAVFNVATIGICRAEQREKACKKLHIDYRLLSHFDQGADRTAAVQFPAPAGRALPGPYLESNLGQGSLSMSRLSQGKAAQQGVQDGNFPQGQGPNPAQVPGMKLEQRQEPKMPHVSDTDFPRIMSGMDVQQRVAECGMPGGGLNAGVMAGAGLGAGGMVSGGMGAGGGMMGGGGGMQCGGMNPNGMQHGGGMVQNGMAGGGLGQNGMGGNGGMGSGNLAGCGLGANGIGGNGGMVPGGMGGNGGMNARMMSGGMPFGMGPGGMGCDLGSAGADFYFGNGGMHNGGMGVPLNGMGSGGGHPGLELGILGGGGNSRKRDQGPKEDDNYRLHPVAAPEMPPYQSFMGLTSSDVEMLLTAPHSRMAMRDFINEVYDGTGLHRKLTHMDMQALLSQAGFPMDSNREHDTISPQQWDEFCSQYRNIVNTLQQITSVWNMEDPVVISGFDMDRAGTITALSNEPAGTFICRFSMSQPGCLVLTCKVGTVHPRADPMGLIHAIIKIDDLHERRVDTWIRDYAGATHLLDVYRQKRVDKRKVFATNYTRLRGLEVGEQQPLGLGTGFM